MQVYFKEGVPEEKMRDCVPQGLRAQALAIDTAAM